MANHPPLPDWLLERYVLGELPPGKLDAVRAQLASDEGARARLEKLDASGQALFARCPPEQAVAEIEHRLARAPRPAEPLLAVRERPWLLAAPALAAAAAVALMVVRSSPAPSIDARGGAVGALIDPGEREKGLRPFLVAYRVRSGQAERLTPGAAVSNGELLQLHYVSAGRRFGVVLSVDGRGEVTLHLSEGRAAAVALQPGGEISLPQAYQLDDAPKFERFFFITSDSPVDVPEVLRAVRELAAGSDPAHQSLRLASGLWQSSLLLEKFGP
jgi:anti-sigma factor RsiW